MTTDHAYWHEMMGKAAANIAKVSEDSEPASEKEVKELVADVLKHGSCKDAAEVIVEAVEFMTAWHMLKVNQPSS